MLARPLDLNATEAFYDYVAGTLNAGRKESFINRLAVIRLDLGSEESLFHLGVVCAHVLAAETL